MKYISNKSKEIIGSKHVTKGILLASVLESTVVPVPIEALLLPVMLARRDKLWTIALAATVGCVIGSLFGYAFGYFLFELTEDWIVGTLATQQQLDSAIVEMQEQGFLFVLSLGIVTVPLQIAMVAAGATGFSLLLYILAVTISRVIRYYGIAIIVYYAGNHAERLIREYKYLATTAVLLTIIAAWYFTLFR